MTDFTPEVAHRHGISDVKARNYCHQAVGNHQHRGPVEVRD
jgi:hypothetical protein